MGRCAATPVSLNREFSLVRKPPRPATTIATGPSSPGVIAVADWSQIVQQHGPLVWTTVYRLLRHDADAADCFQRTFLSALMLSRTQTIRNWPGLLQRLGTARALEALRQRLRQARRLRPLLAEVAVSSSTPEPEQAAAVSELSDHLRQALAQLDARHAQVFCLACLDGLS